MKAKYLSVGELIERLKLYDPDMPVCITREGNDHSGLIDSERIAIKSHPYFPDMAQDDAFFKDKNFLNLANI